ncbi:cysteine dioxygenase family protein [Paraburkholderia azotifigens]|uniref:Cysteine dioxygenase n=1 Tax=Paraburkholderia azotifigens TaxID=2057004 RepID=A0A5C6VRM4_9BURK|nr:cysteine dioxygenase family protein [Paraburkholderia azotifigens]TXC86405.1 cysteine dioxygenase [Paraburkholderia azotifigens]
MNPSTGLNILEASLAESHTSACAMPEANALARLCAALDAAFDACANTCDPSVSAFFARAVRAALAEAAADPALLTNDQREASATCYRRHLLAADPYGRYAVAALVWMPGQASPVHAHHTWCGYAVIDGTLTETLYDWQADIDCASPVREQSREAGAVSFTRAGRTCIHRLGNGSGAAAVSLHIYGVSGEQIATHVNDVVRIADNVQAVPA